MRSTRCVALDSRPKKPDIDHCRPAAVTIQPHLQAGDAAAGSPQRLQTVSHQHPEQLRKRITNKVPAENRQVEGLSGTRQIVATRECQRLSSLTQQVGDTQGDLRLKTAAAGSPATAAAAGQPLSPPPRPRSRRHQAQAATLPAADCPGAAAAAPVAPPPTAAGDAASDHAAPAAGTGSPPV